MTLLSEHKFYSINPDYRHVGNDKKAILTKEFRAPKQGEWYISEITDFANQAIEDSVIPYFIARLVVTRIISIEVIDYEVDNYGNIKGVKNAQY
jgi:hypothetical protein